MSVKRKNPDWRYRDLITNKERPANNPEQGLWDFLHSKTPITDDDLDWAHELHSVTGEKEAMQAWLMAGATNDEIEHWLRIPDTVTAVYRHLFFDINAFRDELAMRTWVKEYEAISKDGARMLREAIEFGTEKLAWLYGRGQAVIDPQRAQQQLMTDAYYRGRSHRGMSLTSPGITVAHAFMNTAIRTAQPLGTTEGEGIINKLLIQLRHRDDTVKVGAEGNTGEDILH